MTDRITTVLDDIPVAMSHCYEPLDLTDDVPIGRPHDPPMDRFADVGHTPEFLEETLRFRAPTADEAEQLAVPVGSIVMEITQILRSADRALEVSWITYVPTRYDSFVYRMPIPRRD